MIGTGVIIRTRFNLGDGCVIGAGTIVVKEVKLFTVVDCASANFLKNLPFEDIEGYSRILEKLV